VYDDIRKQAGHYLERVRRELERNERMRQQTLARLRESVAELAPRYGMERVVAFGSLVWGDFDAVRSDVDLMTWGLCADAALDFCAELGRRLERPVQIVRAEAAADGLVDRVTVEGVPIDVA
jgi:predicted nucleotidyltransferase